MTTHTNMLSEPLVLGDQGSFFFGGMVTKGPDGDTLHTDAAYVKFQAPPDPAWPPIVMWHGGGQHSKTYETTPDGREGYQQIMVRRGHPVHILDQAGRGGATLVSEAVEVAAPKPIGSLLFNVFRLGVWEPPGAPALFPNLSFPTDQELLDQFWFQVPTMLVSETPPTDAMRNFHAAKMGDLFERIGSSILISHSHSGTFGWATAMGHPQAVRAIVSYEPSVYAFPTDEPPPDIPTDNELAVHLTPIQPVSPATFEALTRMPIQIVFGDNIQRDVANRDFGSQFWNRSCRRAEQFVDAINRRGGRAEILHLPDRGLVGNTHFPFTDLNNVEVADLLSEFLSRHGLGAARRSA